MKLKAFNHGDHVCQRHKRDGDEVESLQSWRSCVSAPQEEDGDEVESLQSEDEGGMAMKLKAFSVPFSLCLREPNWFVSNVN